MTDNFGKIMVFGDYEGNLKAIVDKLNSLRWSFELVGRRAARVGRRAKQRSRAGCPQKKA